MDSKSLPKPHAKLVKEIKKTVFASLGTDPYSFISPSAYETAWLAMIPYPGQPSKPMFGGCLSWVLNNQTEHDFWGDCDDTGMPTLGCLVATLACVVALKKSNIGDVMIKKGLEFIHSSSAKKLLKEVEDNGCPRWFAIVFPGMVELAQQVLNIQILKDQVGVVSDIFYHRQLIFQTEKVNKGNYDQLLSYLEVLPSSLYEHFEEEEYIVKHLCEEGSLFQSPSATARAFMATGNPRCLHYLQSLVHRFSNDNITPVPTIYPMSEDLIKLCVINHVQRLGLAEYFTLQIEQVLQQLYKNYLKNGEPYLKPYHSVEKLQLEILKESLYFRLLRMHGYKVSPRNICWFLKNEEIKKFMESNYEYLSVAVFNLYRATDVAFQRDFELDEVRSFSRKLLEKSISIEAGGDHKNPFKNMIKNELSLPWMARLDHLEHRLYIEDIETHALWTGKTSSQRLLGHHNKLLSLAILNYQFKQSIYKTELEELTRWSKDWGLSKMGFGREKTTYCYFAVAASCSLPYDSSLVRMMIAKGAIIVTVVDDFFDMKGSKISELRTFTKAVQRWNDEGLSGVSKKIFDALDNLVKEISTMYFEEEKNHDITNSLRDLWYETIHSWLNESEWSKSGSVPSMDEYLRVGMISIATHTLLLPALCFLMKPTLPNSQLRPTQYQSITKFVMIICRLLNDIQSYEKEIEEGKPNSIIVYMKNNPDVEIEEAIKYVNEILNKRKKELLEHVLIGDGFTDLSKECRLLHLSCLKVFQMFFDSSNRYDSDTELLDDIGKAIYVPLRSLFGGFDDKNIVRVLPKQPTDLPRLKSTTTTCSMNMSHFSRPSKYFVMNELSLHVLNNKVGNWKTTPIMPPKLKVCFI